MSIVGRLLLEMATPYIAVQFPKKYLFMCI